MSKKVNLRAGISHRMREDPVRRERWDFLTESILKDMRGISRIDEASVAEKRISLECLLDNQLRTLDTGSDEPQIFSQERVQDLYEAVLNEDTTIGWDGATTPATAKIFTTNALGMVRRVFPRLIANDLVSVQPMTQPTSKVFFFDIQYDSDGAEGTTQIDAGDAVHDTSLWDFTAQREYADKLLNDTSADIEGGTVREIRLDISSTDVRAKAKKLAHEHSVEAQQDLRSYHGLDADAELSSAVTDEVTREIDRELINFIASTAQTSGAGTVSWNKNGYAGPLPSEQKAWDETLYDAIESAAALVEGKRYRRPNWILGNHNACARLRKLNGFTSRVAGNGTDQTIEMGGSAGRRLFGSLQQQFYIYCDPWFTDDLLILGYKGENFMHAGIVYAPYIPFYRTPQFIDPLTMKMKRGIMSRYGKVAVVPQVFSRVLINAS